MGIFVISCLAAFLLIFLTAVAIQLIKVERMVVDATEETEEKIIAYMKKE
jgi:hypothetical protein